MIRLYKDIADKPLPSGRTGMILDYKDCQISYSTACKPSEVIVVFSDGDHYQGHFAPSAEGIREAMQVIDVWEITRAIQDSQVTVLT